MGKRITVVFKVFIHTEKYKEAQFGLLFAIVSFIFGTYKYFVNDYISYIWLLYLPLCLISLSVLCPNVYYYPNKAWLKLGDIIGNLVNPIILIGIYFGVIVPTSFILHLLGKDILDLKIIKRDSSYWKEKHKTPINYDKQY